MISLEQKILACTACLNDGPSQRERLRRVMAQGVDADRLIETAVKEGLAGLLYRSLMESGLGETLGKEHKARLQSLYYQTAALNLKLTNDLKTVLQVFTEEKIQVVLLQGFALLQEIYDDPGLRPTTDIDLWVLEKDYPGAAKILTSLGYGRDPLYPALFSRGSTIFDLHTHLHGAERNQALKALLAGSQDRAYGATRIMEIEGQRVLCLNRADQVLYLILHALKHYASRLIWLVDIKLLLDRWNPLDWEILVRRAKEVGQEKATAFIISLLMHLFDLQPVGAARELLERERMNYLERKALARRLAGDSLPVWEPFLLVSSGRAWHTRLAVLLEGMFPRPGILRQVFPESAEGRVWELYLKRVLQAVRILRVSRENARSGSAWPTSRVPGTGTPTGGDGWLRPANRRFPVKGEARYGNS